MADKQARQTACPAWTVYPDGWRTCGAADQRDRAHLRAAACPPPRCISAGAGAALHDALPAELSREAGSRLAPLVEQARLRLRQPPEPGR